MPSETAAPATTEEKPVLRGLKKPPTVAPGSAEEALRALLGRALTDQQLATCYHVLSKEILGWRREALIADPATAMREAPPELLRAYGLSDEEARRAFVLLADHAETSRVDGAALADAIESTKAARGLRSVPSPQ